MKIVAGSQWTSVMNENHAEASENLRGWKRIREIPAEEKYLDVYGASSLVHRSTSASTKTLPMAFSAESPGSLHEDPAGPHASPRLTHRQERLSERLRSHFRLVWVLREVR